MTTDTTRREFLQSSTLAAAGVLAHGLFRGAAAQESPTEQLNVGVIGLGRGLAHVNAILNGKAARLNYICDVDTGRLERGMKTVEGKIKDLDNKPEMPTPIGDLRRMLDDPKLDAIFVATTNHWHAPAAILGCTAGKHVYVEKPGSHTPWEGEQLIAAARKYNRVVQMGNQRRTWPGVQEMVQKLHDGAIGKLLYARCFYESARESIGIGKPAPVPASLNWDLWQGPAPEREYKDNLVPYNWHWHWHYGNGELGNNGIHSLDVARWGLNVTYPKKITYLGGRYHFQDDQETPDTGTAVYDFGHCGISWECSSCHPRREEKLPICIFYGTEGTMHNTNTGWVQYDLQGKEVGKGNGPGGEQDHIDNFLGCIKSGETPNSEIEVGQTSTLLCHLGNIAYRTNSVLDFDGTSRKIVGNEEAAKLWKREYRDGWEPRI